MSRNVEELYPELIHEMNVFNDTMSIKTVDYSRLNTILIEVLKDNQKYILSFTRTSMRIKEKIRDVNFMRKIHKIKVWCIYNIYE